MAILVCGIATTAAATGCGPAGLREIHSPDHLRQLIAESEQPVLVDFYKQGCEHCSGLDIGLTHIIGQQQGRLTAAKFLLLRADGSCVDQALADEHNVLVYPTVLLFVGGKEVRRFEQNYNYDDYEKAIDEYCRPKEVAP